MGRGCGLQIDGVVRFHHTRLHAPVGSAPNPRRSFTFLALFTLFTFNVYLPYFIYLVNTIYLEHIIYY